MLTVLTATFNRAHTLGRLFDSLLAQSNNRFEWLIIDDGSSDGTKEVVSSMQRNSNLNIRYFSQCNAGKHVAINSGVSHARGDWIFIVDSDDALTPDAIDVVLAEVNKNLRQDFQGVVFRKSHFDYRLIGQELSSNEPFSMHPTEAASIFSGDLAYIFRRDALLNNRFPVFSGEKLVPELYIWNKIGDSGKLIFYGKKVVCLCEYLEDGYSANFKSCMKQSPRGFGLFYRDQFFREASIIRKIKCAIRAGQCYFYQYLGS